MAEELWAKSQSNGNTLESHVAIAETELDLEEDSIVVLDMMPPTRLQFREDEHIDSCAIDGSHIYSDEWNRLFKSMDSASVLTSYAFDGELRSCRFRSVCWKIFLHCLPQDQSRWMQAAKQYRQHYDQLKSNFIINPRKDCDKLDPIVNNPLSQEESSPWNRYFQDSELKMTIQQDVLRTFPEVEFFQSSQVRELMINILFCYAREHPEISYRQGMHELLAPIMFVLHSDQQAYLHAVEIEFVDTVQILVRFSDVSAHCVMVRNYFKQQYAGGIDDIELPLNIDEMTSNLLFQCVGKVSTNPLEIVSCVLDHEYLEHDAYSMFNKLMKNVESWYLIREENSINQFTLGGIKPFPRPQDSKVYTVVISKLNNIHDSLLKRHDPELYNHLERMEIAPQIFGIRWLRLLFGREFALQDLLVIWDVIFADGRNFGLVDYIFISMLEYIKPSLLNSDYATCLGYLMRYPAIADIHYIIDFALHIREPLKYKKPTGHNHHMIQHVPMVGGRPEIHRSPMFRKQSLPVLESSTQQKGKPGNKVMSGISSLTRKMSRPSTLKINSSPQHSRPHRSSMSSTEPTSFKSKSPSPELAECAQAEVDFIHEVDKACAATSSNQALVTTAAVKNGGTEMRSMGPAVLERAATLPRAYRRESLPEGLSNGVGFNRYVNGIALGEEIQPFNTDQVMSRSGSLKMSTRGQKYTTKQKPFVDSQKEIEVLQAKVTDYSLMRTYCSQKMTVHIERLQECLVKQALQDEDKILIALAGMKQVRDILKGTLKFNDNHMAASDDRQSTARKPPSSEKLGDDQG